MQYFDRRIRNGDRQTDSCQDVQDGLIQNQLWFMWLEEGVIQGPVPDLFRVMEAVLYGS